MLSDGSVRSVSVERSANIAAKAITAIAVKMMISAMMSLIGSLPGTITPGPPMTSGNMRKLGVHSLAVTCQLCHHEAVVPADRWGDDVQVRAFRLRIVCTRCRIIGADERPNWREMKPRGIGGRLVAFPPQPHSDFN